MSITSEPHPFLRITIGCPIYTRDYQKVGVGDAYTVNLAAYSYLMNPKGRFACVLPYDLTPEQTAAKIKAAMTQGAGAESC